MLRPSAYPGPEVTAMGTIRIDVKGDEKAAREALERRGLEARLVVQGGHSTYWDVAEDRLADLVRWFGEAPGQCPPGGYEPGTLLFYR